MAASMRLVLQDYCGCRRELLVPIRRKVSTFLKKEPARCKYIFEKVSRLGCNYQQTRSLFGWLKKKPKPEKHFPRDPPSYNIVVPGTLSPKCSLPEDIPKPEYADTGVASKIYYLPILLDEEEMDLMREAGAMARKILDIGASCIQPGVTTDSIDKEINAACIENRVYPSTLNYRGFPKSVCTSVNNVMAHGVPDDRPLQDGDLINIDFTVYLNGYHGDTSETYVVGRVDDRGQCLVDVARQCRDAAIEKCSPFAPFSHIGKTIQSTAEANGFHVCPSFLGHGIGKQFHCKPTIWHHHNNYKETMLPGMAFTIEPLLLERKDSFITADDGWTALARNNTRSAQFEHTVLITRSGVEVLTKSADEHFKTEDKASSTDPLPQQEDPCSGEDEKTESKDTWKFN